MSKTLNELKILWQELKETKKKLKQVKRDYKGLNLIINICKKYNFELTKNIYNKTLIIHGINFEFKEENNE